MFSRLSNLFGSKKKTATTQPESVPSDSRLKYVDYGSLRLVQAKDHDSLALLSEHEIAKMITDWRDDLADLNNMKDLFRHFLVDLKTLSKLPASDSSVLGPVSKLSYIIKSDEPGRELDLSCENNTGLPGLNVSVFSDERTSDKVFTKNLKITYRDKVVLDVNIYNSYDLYDSYSDIKHFLPGEWLTKMMPLMETEFAQSISDLAEAKHRTEAERHLLKYETWANGFGGKDLIIGGFQFPVPLVDPRQPRSEQLESFRELENIWYEQFIELFDRSFDMFNLDDVMLNAENPTIKNILDNLNFSSISTTGLDTDVHIENPLATSGISLTYKVVKDSTNYDDQYLNFTVNGETVLSLSSDYRNLIVGKLIPGPWMESIKPFLDEDLSKLQGIARNLKVTGEDVDNRTLASSVFDI